MDARSETEVQRNSEREVVVTRTVNGPARIVFEAWTKPELFKRWWAPKSMGMSLRSCEMDVRVGGNTVSSSNTRRWRSSVRTSK